MRLLHSSVVSAAALKQDLALDAGATVLNHSMNLVQRMESLLAMGNGSDVTLRVHTINTDEVKVIQAHSLVLTMQSDVFEELLLTRNNSIVVLRETSDCAAVFDKFIRYGWRVPRPLHNTQIFARHTYSCLSFCTDAAVRLFRSSKITSTV